MLILITLKMNYLRCIGVGCLGVLVDGHRRQDDVRLVRRHHRVVLDDVAQHRFQHCLRDKMFFFSQEKILFRNCTRTDCNLIMTFHSINQIK